MEEWTLEDGFEATFVVSVPRDVAWARLAGAQPARDGLGAARPGQWWIPAVEAPADEVEVDPRTRLHAKKAVEPCKGTDIVITLEDADTGTRITIVQTGFGDGFRTQRPWLHAGWLTILADLVTFFERGVSLGRHAARWWSIGCDVRETGGGLEVASVHPAGFAHESGLQPGDLILHLAGAPIVDIRDLSVLTRGPLRTGAQTNVRYLRGTDVLTGTGTIA